MSTCGQRRGFLTLFRCGEPATAACASCGKMICAKHLHTGANGQCCPDCAVVGMNESDASSHDLDSSYHRSRSGSGDGTTYSDTEYGTFDPVTGGGGEMGGGGASGEWDDGSGASDDSGDFGAADFQDS